MSKRYANITDKHEVISDWVRHYADQLYTWAFYKTSNEAVAADMVQDTFISAFQHYHNFKGSSSAKTWLFSILKNKVTDHFRKTIKIKSISLNSDDEGSFEWFDHHGQWKKEFRPEPWHINDNNLLDDIEFKDVLANCMGRLPSAWSACVQLKYLGEKETNEICQQLNITASNLWQILHRAKLHLRACLEKNWFKSDMR